MAESRQRKPRRAAANTGDDGSDGIPQARAADGRLSVIVELHGQLGMSASFAATELRAASSAMPFDIDEEFEPVPLGAGATLGLGMAAAPASYAVRALVTDEAAIAEIQQRSDVVAVWPDAVVAPFQCPIPPCDCDFGTPKGTIADVANYLGVSQIWAAGFRGTGMVVGIVDGGITAQGRPVVAGETARRIPRVIAGWPVADWGTRAALWGEHGNMCATDVLGMAPEAQLLDMRISGTGGSPATISRALQAFQWAIDRHRVDGTPHVLSNSWGIFQETWDTTYARDPNHPFTRKVMEAIDEGIIVLFAAGNCGGTCPDGRCGPDSGPGRSIWGANSLERVMTVGAVNRNEQFVGYSSQGPGALHNDKPDFCSVTHFTGYFPSDGGTSAATPILAGAVALLKQAVPAATQDGLRAALKATAKDIGPPGFDLHSGAGIVRPKAALDSIMPRVTPPTRAVWCRPSVVTPCVPLSRITMCQPTRIQQCFVTRINCPSRIEACLPSRIVLCQPVTRIPRCIVPTAPPGCAVPTRVCPSIACVPQPGPELGAAAGEEWAAEPGYDPGWAAWYGYAEAPWTEEEQWYGY